METFEVKSTKKIQSFFENLFQSFQIFQDSLSRKSSHINSHLFQSLKCFQSNQHSFQQKLEEIFLMKKQISHIEKQFCPIDPFVIKKRQGVSLFRAFLNHTSSENFLNLCMNLNQELNFYLKKELMKDLDQMAVEEKR